MFKRQYKDLNILQISEYIIIKSLEYSNLYRVVNNLNFYRLVRWSNIND